MICFIIIDTISIDNLIYGRNELENEKRKFKRLALRLSVLCQKVGDSGNIAYTGKTINASPGGMYLEISNATITKGDMLNIEMSIPPTEGLLDFGGRFSSYGKIVRIDQDPSNHDSPRRIQRMAVEFCESPKFKV